MNLSLLDPFAVAKEFPESLSNTLNFHHHSTFIKFNRKGDYLASGSIDGSILIVDYDTNGIIKILKNHTRAITSLSWSKCGRFLLSSSRDWKVCLWDLSTCEVIRSITFQSAIWNSELNPKNYYQFTASIFEDDPIFVDMSNDQDIIIQKLIDSKINITNEDKNGILKKQYTLYTTFHPSGDFIISGTSKGVINIIELLNFQIVYSNKLTNSNIKSITISHKNNKMAINSSDRIIRQINLIDLKNTPSEEWYFEVEHKYQDVVNKLQWNSISFNYTGEYLIASTFGSSHDIYMWETSMGSLIKILEGPKEELYDVDWNFKKCCIGCTGLDSGTIYIWSIIIPQKWSALAPDFVEIEENIEYDEKEDEFDTAIEEDYLTNNIDDNSNDIIDITTKDIVDARGLAIRDSFVIPVDLDELDTIDNFTSVEALSSDEEEYI
ncbi:hypothetical protein PACTADRAFT_47911 [Pachysolen tannophilus NRRL Y-2460]|uniref:Uncharacterized protein n=1 Tax=Pachysolen tannophilus NRRL Y-2460 TaxID=669874 RepID=A0A1E4U271_PACTA|nr:hypothetical protein PACTADRAFT_47911 [Pachysolen tannophilus NRRL Y-2460]